MSSLICHFLELPSFCCIGRNWKMLNRIFPIYNSIRLKTKGLPPFTATTYVHFLTCEMHVVLSQIIFSSLIFGDIWAGEWFYWNQDKALGFYKRFPERRTVRSRRLPLTSPFLNYSLIHCCLTRRDVNLSLKGWEDFRVSRHFVPLLLGVL